MRHHNHNRIFGRSRSQRTALIRGLAISLIENDRIKTTEARAKELRPFVEKLITHAKNDTVFSKRNVRSTLGEPKIDIITKLFTDISKKYTDRNGGYTRIVKIGETPAGRREAYIEFV